MNHYIIRIPVTAGKVRIVLFDTTNDRAQLISDSFSGDFRQVSTSEANLAASREGSIVKYKTGPQFDNK
jgi:ribosomal protein L18